MRREDESTTTLREKIEFIFAPKRRDLLRYERKKKNETLMEAGGGAQKSLMFKTQVLDNNYWVLFC